MMNLENVSVDVLGDLESRNGLLGIKVLLCSNKAQTRKQFFERFTQLKDLKHSHLCEYFDMFRGRHRK